MGSEQRPYRAYLVRLWQEGGAASAVWRASAEEPRTGRRYGFASLEALCAFLEAQTRGDARPRQRPPPAPGKEADEASR